MGAGISSEAFPRRCSEPYFLALGLFKNSGSWGNKKLERLD